MRFYVYEHQHKAKPYVDALMHAGYRVKHRIAEGIGFVMIDHEWDGLFAGYIPTKFRSQIAECEQLGIPVFVYPHSVRPNIPFDLTREFHPNICALFTIAEGHKVVLKKLGYPNPIEVVGWPYTEICSFRRNSSIEKVRVLFAPLHPVGGSFLPDIDRKLNAKTYKLLLGLLDRIDLTVRHIGSLKYNNIEPDQHVRFIAGQMDGSTHGMENSDIVIGAYTYAYMAVALGHPLVMLGEGVRPHNSPRSGGQLIWAQNWEKYRDYMAYPFNVEDCQTSEDLYDMLKLAMGGDQGIDNWKQRFIGEPFNGQSFVKTLESYL